MNEDKLKQINDIREKLKESRCKLATIIDKEDKDWGTGNDYGYKGTRIVINGVDVSWTFSAAALRDLNTRAIKEITKKIDLLQKEYEAL